MTSQSSYRMPAPLKRGAIKTKGDAELGNSIIIFSVIMILVLVGVYAYLLYVEKKNTSWIDKQASHARMAYSFKKIKFIGWLQGKMAMKLAITNTGTKQDNERYAIVALGIIAAFATVLFILMSSMIDRWYSFILVLAMSIVIPVVFFNIYHELMLSKMIKELPLALDEFCSSYRNSNKIFTALRDSYPNMPKMISKEFERLYKSYNIDFEEGIEFFRSRVKNDWAGIFASLLVINHTQGGSIVQQLDDLNSEIENDILSREKTRSKMLGFKLISLSTLALVPAVIYANMLMSENAKEYYATTQGMNDIQLTMVVGFITFLCTLFVEKL